MKIVFPKGTFVLIQKQNKQIGYAKIVLMILKKNLNLKKDNLNFKVCFPLVGYRNCLCGNSEEVGLYYLNSRHYDPSINRFISTDSIDYLEYDNFNGLNLYAYWKNNPIMYADPSGYFIISIGLSTAICSVIIALVAVSTVTTIAYTERKTHFISNAINSIVDNINEIVENVKNIILTYAVSLIVAKRYDLLEKHHIVAKRDHRALFSRIILEKAKIEINVSKNTVYVKK